jgi:hypothetical protein
MRKCQKILTLKGLDWSEVPGYHQLIGQAERSFASYLLAKVEASQKFQESSDMIWMTKLIFGGGISGILILAGAIMP